MIGPTPRMLGGGWTIAGAVARCKPIPDPIVAVVSSRKRAVHSPGATAAQRALESYKAERESCRAIYSTQHIRSSTCGETAEDRERSRRDRHRAKLALPETSRPEGVNGLHGDSHLLIVIPCLDPCTVCAEYVRLAPLQGVC